MELVVVRIILFKGGFYMNLSKKYFSILLVLLLLMTFIPTSLASNSASPSPWASEEIEDAKLNQLVTPDVLNNYQQNITREEFAELAVKLYESLSKQQATTGSNPFVDTSNPEILKANNLGIVGGISKNKFAPQQFITRQEICVMLLRTIKAAVPQSNYSSPDDLTFSDEIHISPWAIDAVKYLNFKGVMGGIGDNRINPKGNATREQAIVLVQRTFKEFIKDPVTLVVGTSSSPYSLDPHSTNDVGSSRVMVQIYETLLSVDENNELVPGLAKSWKQIDSYTYEFTLKEGIKVPYGS